MLVRPKFLHIVSYHHKLARAPLYRCSAATYKMLLNVCFTVFRLDALALSVIATETWLGGWLGGRLSHSGIVSKPLNLSENFFDHLKAPSL